jgi:RNA polymerase sigma-70 factor (ECF subfamily)
MNRLDRPPSNPRAPFASRVTAAVPGEGGKPEERKPETDGEAVSCVLGGDKDAFGTLVEAYQPAVLGLCRRLLFGNGAEAEEVTQESFLRAYKFLPRLEDRDRFAPWLYQIARSLCRDRRRRARVEQRALAERAEMLRRQELKGGPDPASESMNPMLAELPVEEQKVILLRYFEGLSYDEISQRLNMSFSQVDHLIRKARARLAHRLEVRQRIEST